MSTLGYSDEELIRELQRRGYSCTKQQDLNQTFWQPLHPHAPAPRHFYDDSDFLTKNKITC
jgi:hypothetical protein